MFAYGGFKGFITKICFGVFFLAISTYLFFVFMQNGINFNEFINTSTKQYAVLYPGSLAFIFFGPPIYIFLFFFFITGTKYILGINHKRLSVKIFLLLVFTIFTNLYFKVINITFHGEAGVIFYDLLPKILKINLENNLIRWFSEFLIIIFLVLILFFCFDFKIKILNIFFKKFFKVFSFIIFILKFITPKFSQKLQSQNIKTNKKIKLSRNNFKKSEPILKKNIKINKTFKKQRNNENIEYELPPMSLLNFSNEKLKSTKEIDKRNNEFAKKLEIILSEYGVEGKIVNYKYGPVVTLYEFLPAAGIKTSKVVGLSDDIARAMSSLST